MIDVLYIVQWIIHLIIKKTYILGLQNYKKVFVYHVTIVANAHGLLKKIGW